MSNSSSLDTFDRKGDGDNGCWEWSSMEVEGILIEVLTEVPIGVRVEGQASILINASIEASIEVLVEVYRGESIDLGVYCRDVCVWPFDLT